MTDRVRVHQGRLTRALVIEGPDPELDDLLREDGFDVVRVDTAPDKAELLGLVREHRPQLLFKRSRVQVDADVLDAAPDLFAVMLCCIGDDSVDKQAASERGVLVMNDPRSNGRSVAEMVIGQLLVASRRLVDAWRDTRDGIWSKSSDGRFEVQGKVLGILGLGNIGRQVARLAEGLGLRVLFYDTDEVARGVGEAMEWTIARSMGELFSRSDIVTVHLSAEDNRGRSNTGLITAGVLRSLGSERGDASPRIFLNLARGMLFEPADLVAAVDDGLVRQAYVDVFPDEPGRKGPGWRNPYAQCAAIHATPHIGAATRDAQPRIGRKMARTAVAFSHRGALVDCVFAPRRPVDVASSALSSYILTVVHIDHRGTKKAVDDVIYRAGVSNLQSAHRDFPRFGIAYEVSVIDRPLSDDELQQIVDAARDLTGDSEPILAMRQVTLE